jgi:hypothetical protein
MELQLDVTITVFIDLLDKLNMFRANICPSSGAQELVFYSIWYNAIQISYVNRGCSVYHVPEHGRCHEIDAGFLCNEAVVLGDTIKQTSHILYSIRKVQRHTLHEAVENAGKKNLNFFLRASRRTAIQ